MFGFALGSVLWDSHWPNSAHRTCDLITHRICVINLRSIAACNFRPQSDRRPLYLRKRRCKHRFQQWEIADLEYLHNVRSFRSCGHFKVCLQSSSSSCHASLRFETCQLEGVQQCSTWTRTSITPCLERPGGGLCRGDLILLRALPDSSVQNQASENLRSRVADRCFSQGCLAGECHTLSYCKACC